MTAVELQGVTTRRSSLDVVLRARELGILLALALLVAVTAISNHRFLSGQSIRDILLGTAILAVLAVGQAVVVITRNIDLSVGSVLGLSAFTVGTLLRDHPGMPVILALLVGAAGGGVCGAVNGVLVRYGNVPALVVTLGTLYVVRGITYFWAGGQQINADELPSSFLDFGNATLLGIPYLVVIALLALVVTGVVLRNYRVGRELYAMGSSPQAARLAGLPVGGVRSAPSASAARWPGWRGCCSRQGSARSMRRPAPATSSMSLPP